MTKSMLSTQHLILVEYLRCMMFVVVDMAV